MLPVITRLRWGKGLCFSFYVEASGFDSQHRQTIKTAISLKRNFFSVHSDIKFATWLTFTAHHGTFSSLLSGRPEVRRTTSDPPHHQRTVIYRVWYDNEYFNLSLIREALKTSQAISHYMAKNQRFGGLFPFRHQVRWLLLPEKILIQINI